jgi:hypothetical protein
MMKHNITDDYNNKEKKIILAINHNQFHKKSSKYTKRKKEK